LHVTALAHRYFLTCSLRNILQACGQFPRFIFQEERIKIFAEAAFHA
jgi:hypothetical protein